MRLLTPKELEMVEAQVSVAPLMRREAVEYTPVENDNQRHLRAALALLGPNGEFWIRYHLFDGNSRCAYGALNKVVFGIDVKNWADSAPVYRAGFDHPGPYRFLRAAAEERGHLDASEVNNHAKSFSEVRSMFERAITLAATAHKGG